MELTSSPVSGAPGEYVMCVNHTLSLTLGIRKHLLILQGRSVCFTEAVGPSWEQGGPPFTLMPSATSGTTEDMVHWGMRNMSPSLTHSLMGIFPFLKKEFIYVFPERKERRDKEGEKCQCVVASHMPQLGTWPATQAHAPTGNRTRDPLVCKLALSPLSHTSQGPMGVYS